MFLHYEHLFIYPCKVKEVVSGDTVKLILDLGFGITKEITLVLSFFSTEVLENGDQQKYKFKAVDFFSDNEGPFFVETYNKQTILGSWKGEIFCNSEPDDMGRCAKNTLSQNQKIEWKPRHGS